MAKDFLTKKGFTFEDKNVALDEAAANDLVEKSGQMGVPVIEIDDQIVIGFDQVALEDLLK